MRVFFRLWGRGVKKYEIGIIIQTQAFEMHICIMSSSVPFTFFLTCELIKLVHKCGEEGRKTSALRAGKNFTVTSVSAFFWVF